MKWGKRQAKDRQPPHGNCDCVECKPFMHAKDCGCEPGVKGKCFGPVPYETPTLTEKVIGFRAWTLDGYKLLSANAALKGYWQIGVNRAECKLKEYREQWVASGYVEIGEKQAPAKHTAPHPDCECGLYAWHDPASLRGWMNFNYGSYVYGAVTAWGQVEVHEQGFRAEYAEPVVLAYDEGQPYRSVIALQAIAAEMDLPLVTMDELEGASKGFGEVIAPRFRPKPRRQSSGVYTGVAFASGGFVQPAPGTIYPLHGTYFAGSSGWSFSFKEDKDDA